MAFNAGALQAFLTLNISQFTAGIRQSISAARNAANQMRSQFNNLNLNNTTRQISQMGMSFKDMGRIVNGIMIAQTFYQIEQSIKSAVKELWNFNMFMEKTQVSLTGMLGSSSRATGFIESVKDIAVVSEFTTEQVTDLSRKLIAVGIDARSAVPIMRILGDETAYLGGGADKLDRIAYNMSQIKESSTVSKRDLRDLSNALVPVNKYLKEAGINLEETSKLKGIDAFKIILQGMQKDSKGYMQKIAETTSGMTMTIKDDLLLVGEKISGGLFTMFSGYIRKVRDFLETVRDTMKTSGIGGVINNLFPPGVATSIRSVIGMVQLLWKAFKELGNILGPVVKQISVILITVLGAVGPPIARIVLLLLQLVDAAMKNIPGLKTLAAAFLGLLTALMAAKAIMFLYNILKIGTIFATVARAVDILAIAFKGLYVAMSSHPIVAIVTLIAGALLYLAYTAGWLDGILNKLQATFAAFTGIDTSKIAQPFNNSEIKKSMEEFNQGLGDMADSTDDVGDAAGGAKKKVDKFIAAFDEVFQVPEKLDDAAGAIAGIGKGFDLDFGGDDDKGGGGDKYPPKGVAPITPSMLDKIKDILDKMVDAVKPVFGKLADLAARAAAEIEDAFSDMVDAVARVTLQIKRVREDIEKEFKSIEIGDVLEPITMRIDKVINKLREVARTWYINIVAPAIDTVINTVEKLGNTILNSLKPENILKISDAFLTMESPIYRAANALNDLSKRATGLSIVDNIKVKITSLVDTIANINWQELGNTFVKGLKLMIKNFTGYDLFKGFFEYFSKGTFASDFGKAFNKTGSQLSNLWESIGVNWVTVLRKTIKTGIGAIFDIDLREALKNIFKGNTITKAAEDGGQALLKVLEMQAKLAVQYSKKVGPKQLTTITKAAEDGGQALLKVLEMQAKLAVQHSKKVGPKQLTRVGSAMPPLEGPSAIDFILGTAEKDYYPKKKVKEQKTYKKTGKIGLTHLDPLSKIEPVSNVLKDVDKDYEEANKRRFKTIADGWERIKKAYTTFGGGFELLAGNNWAEVSKIISNAWDGITTWISNHVDDIRNTLSNWGDNISTWFRETWDNIGKIVSNTWDNILTWVSERIENVRQTLYNWGDNISTWFRETWDNIGKIVSNTWDNILTWVSERTTSIWTTIQNWGTNIGNYFSNIWGNVQLTVSNAWNNIWNTISNITSGIWNTISGWGTNIGTFFSNLWQGVLNTASNFRTNISKAFSGIVGSIKNIFNEMIDVINRVLKAINSISISIPKSSPIMGGTKMGFNIPLIPKLASGGIVMQDTLARLGEGNRKEAVIPLQNNSVLQPFIRGLAAQIKDILFSSNGGNSTAPSNYYNIGTFIGDNRTLAELERRLSAVRVQENIRRGV